MIKQSDIRYIYPQLEQFCGNFFNSEEKKYLFPLIVRWAGSETQAATWFQSEAIPACGNKTAIELCNSNQMKTLISYIRHIELGGFS